MKKVLAILLALATLLVFAGCAKQADAPAADGQTYDVLIGISMPTHSDESWLRHCELPKTSSESSATPSLMSSGQKTFPQRRSTRSKT